MTKADTDNPLVSFDLPRSDNANETLSVVLENFLTNPRFTEETRRAYRREVQGFLKLKQWEHLCLAALKKRSLIDLCNAVQSYLVSRLTIAEQTSQIQNPRTFNRSLYALKSFFGYLVRFYGLQWNPLDYFQKLEVPTESNTSDLSEEELLELLRCLQQRANESQIQARNFLLILGLFLEGLRRREITEIKWQDIDFVNQTVVVVQKGRKQRTKPVPEGYLQLLSAYRVRYAVASEFVFTSIQNKQNRNKPLSGNYVYLLIKKIAANTFPERNITPHSLRASFVTLALKWKQDPLTILHGTGHSSLKMIDYYDKRQSLLFNCINFFGNYLNENGIFDTVKELRE